MVEPHVAAVVARILETWAVEGQEEARIGLLAEQPRHSVPGDCSG